MRRASLKTDFETWMGGARAQPGWGEETLGFMEKVLLNSGVGPQTYMPAGALLSLSAQTSTTQPGPIACQKGPTAATGAVA